MWGPGLPQQPALSCDLPHLTLGSWRTLSQEQVLFSPRQHKVAGTVPQSPGPSGWSKVSGPPTSHPGQEPGLKGKLAGSCEARPARRLGRELQPEPRGEEGPRRCGCGQAVQVGPAGWQGYAFSDGARSPLPLLSPLPSTFSFLPSSLITLPSWEKHPACPRGTPSLPSVWSGLEGTGQVCGEGPLLALTDLDFLLLPSFSRRALPASLPPVQRAWPLPSTVSR